MTQQRIRTILEASLHDEPLLVFETGLGEMAEPRHIESRPGFWRLTGAWSRDRPVDGYMIECWLRGLRPQNGARSAQTARARERLRALDIRRTAPDQGDIVWATPHMEYPGAVRFRSLMGDDRELAPERGVEHALSARELETLLDQVVHEMRRGSIDPQARALDTCDQPLRVGRGLSQSGEEISSIPESPELAAAGGIHLVEHRPALPFPAALAEKDRPIFQAAAACGATHLLTGDSKDFGPFMNQPQETFGVVVQTVAEFLLR